MGIGRAIAQRFAQEGAKVVIADYNRTEGQKTTALLVATHGPGCASYCYADSTDESTIKACVAHCERTYGRLDVLVNNAAAFVFGHLGGAGRGSGTGTDKDISQSDWARVLGTNVIGYANWMKHSAALMRVNRIGDYKFNVDQGEGVTTIQCGSRGVIVNVASISSFIAQPEFVPYNASKGAVLQMTRCTAMDFAPLKIRVNAICPGTIDTPGSYNHMKLLGLSVEQGKKEFGGYCLLQRQGAPEEIANGVLFLASDDSSFMTGAHLVMDGGGTI